METPYPTVNPIQSNPYAVLNCWVWCKDDESNNWDLVKVKSHQGVVCFFMLLMILVSYIFRIKHEYFFYIENYTFWVVTGLVSSSSAYKMNTHGMLSLWWWWWWFNHFDTVLMMVMRPICNDNVYGCGGDGHTFSEQSPYFGAPVIQTPSIARHGQKIGNIGRGHKYTIQKRK